MEFRILGPVEVRVAGQCIDAGHARQRAVLAVLILDLCRVVSAEMLIDRVWGEDPPTSVRNVLYGYVARLRAMIADVEKPGVTLTRYQGGYLLQAEPEQVDVYCFRRMAAEAAAAGQDDQRAATLLDDALTLWHGTALTGLDSPWLEGMRHRLEMERVAAVLDLNEIRLRQGQHGALAGELAEQAAATPTDERLIGQLMLALYRSGQQAEALHWFERTRLYLADELGADPGPELQRLHQQILTADPALELKDPQRLTVDGAVQIVPRQLPAAVPHFTGRAHELEGLTELLNRSGEQTPGTVVISAIGGTAGVGKTALAVHWAHQVAERFPDGQLYANLRGYDPSRTPTMPADVARRFLNALGVPDSQIPSDPDSWESLYRSTLADKRVLIVLDNARDAAQIRPLLPGGPGCFVLVTSRDQLTSLAAAEGAHMLTVDLLSQADAKELVARRLDRERIRDEPEAVSELIQLCARLPIAVSIAVARAATHPAFPLACLVAELRDAGSRLDVLDAGYPGSSVRAVFSWSYMNLSVAAARMFRLLSVHAGPDISIPAAASLAGLPRDQARRAVAELTGSHLLAEHVHGRFTFHDLLRAYAADQARTQDTDAERDAALYRLLDHYLHTSHAISRLLDPTLGMISLALPQPGVFPEVPDDYVQAWAWAESEHQVLLAAVTQAAAARFETYAWQILRALEPFFFRRGLGLDSADAGQARIGGRPYRDPRWPLREVGALLEARASTLEEAFLQLVPARDPDGMGQAGQPAPPDGPWGSPSPQPRESRYWPRQAPRPPPRTHRGERREPGSDRAARPGPGRNHPAHRRRGRGAGRRRVCRRVVPRAAQPYDRRLPAGLHRRRPAGRPHLLPRRRILPPAGLGAHERPCPVSDPRGTGANRSCGQDGSPGAVLVYDDVEALIGGSARSPRSWSLARIRPASG